MSSPSASRAKGTAWETAIATYLRENGAPHAERRAQHGNKDLGDIAGIPGLVIEAKACRQAEWGTWTNEADREAQNVGPGTLGILWAKRVKKTSPADAYVVMTGRQLITLLQAAGYLTKGATDAPTPEHS